MANQGIYRAGENEFLDMTKQETLDWLAPRYPAIMATRPVGMSDEYQFMPSHAIATRLQTDFGMKLVEVGQQFSRARNPAGQEHMMRFRLPNDLIRLKEVGDSVPEIVIMNSHNGRSTIRALAGVFRLICSNGMVVSERSFGQIKLRHFGEANSYSEFAKTLDAMAGGMVKLDQRMGAMSKLMLSPHHQNTLARTMMKARGVPDWMEPSMVLEARRKEDLPNEDGTRSLWLTFNVLQENLTTKQVTIDVPGGRNRSIRPLTGARATVLSNERIWEGMEAFVEGHFPKHAADIFDASKTVIEGIAIPVKPEATPAGEKTTAEEAAPEEAVAPVDQPLEEEAQEEPIVLRSFDQLIALGTYDEMLAITPEELAALAKEERTKITKRRSYLKSKEQVVNA